MSNPNPPAAAPPWIRGLGLVALLVYGIYLAWLFNPIATAADASGYLNSAKLLAAGKLTDTSRIVPELNLRTTFQLVPLGFTIEPREGSLRLAPTYPVGVPLQFAVASKFAGWTVGPYLVCVGGALAAVWLCYLCARELGVSPLLALAGAVALGASPIFVFIGIQPLSDVLATTWCLAAAYGALRVRREAGVAWALGCGFACAMAVLVRPSNILVLPAIALLAGRWRPLLFVALGGLPAALGLLAYQHHLYGDALRSGYGSIFTVFYARIFWPAMRHYGLWVPALLCPAFAALLLTGPARGVRLAWTALVLWAGAIFLFYAFYVVTIEDWTCLRFVLPAFPPVILAGLLGAERLAQKFAAARVDFFRSALALGLLLWTAFATPYFGKRVGMIGASVSDWTYVDTTAWLRDHVPTNAVVASMVGSGAIHYYTGFPILRWDMLKPADAEAYALALQRAGRPFYALLFDGAEPRALEDHLVGRWRVAARFNGATLWQWTGPR